MCMHPEEGVMWSSDGHWFIYFTFWIGCGLFLKGLWIYIKSDYYFIQPKMHSLTYHIYYGGRGGLSDLVAFF
ncbi:unnamed protein product [Phytomonas sp. Hart1]|nr:unnamed protein product [Phytomonas sp. Hart1]|eukprot:CCW70812.1 unnamed protein product [Phytomonas sp. isolate Hart1]